MFTRGQLRLQFTRDELRSELNRHLPPPISEAHWRFLDEEGEIDSACESGRIDAALSLLRRLRRLNREPAPRLLPPRGKPKDVTERVRAISVVLAAEASREEGIEAFRAQVLAGVLLEREGVEAFIMAERAKEPDEESMLIAQVAAPARSLRNQRSAEWVISGRFKVIGVEQPVLSYGVPEDDWTRSVAVSHGGVLCWLRDLCDGLAKTYRWQEAQACLFVLTGAVPVVPGLRAEVSRVPDPSCTSRITLVVDPTLTPRELADRYREIRRTVIGGRHRSLSSKHLELAAFAASKEPEESWAEALEAWNKDHEPGDRYPKAKVKTFARDCRVALRRLRNPPIDWSALA